MRTPMRTHDGSKALEPFFEIMKGLSGVVDGDHYLDTIAGDATFEFLYEFPGRPEPAALPMALIRAKAIASSSRSLLAAWPWQNTGQLKPSGLKPPVCLFSHCVMSASLPR